MRVLCCEMGELFLTPTHLPGPGWAAGFRLPYFPALLLSAATIALRTAIDRNLSMARRRRLGRGDLEPPPSRSESPKVLGWYWSETPVQVHFSLMHGEGGKHTG